MAFLNIFWAVQGSDWGHHVEERGEIEESYSMAYVERDENIAEEKVVSSVQEWIVPQISS